MWRSSASLTGDGSGSDFCVRAGAPVKVICPSGSSKSPIGRLAIPLPSVARLLPWDVPVVVGIQMPSCSRTGRIWHAWEGVRPSGRTFPRCVCKPMTRLCSSRTPGQRSHNLRLREAWNAVAVLAIRCRADVELDLDRVLCGKPRVLRPVRWRVRVERCPDRHHPAGRLPRGAPDLEHLYRILGGIDDGDVVDDAPDVGYRIRAADLKVDDARRLDLGCVLGAGAAAALTVKVDAAIAASTKYTGAAGASGGTGSSRTGHRAG